MVKHSQTAEVAIQRCTDKKSKYIKHEVFHFKISVSLNEEWCLGFSQMQMMALFCENQLTANQLAVSHFCKITPSYILDMVLNVVRCAKPATLLKLTLLHGCFSRFLNCTNATKSRNAPQIRL